MVIPFLGDVFLVWVMVFCAFGIILRTIHGSDTQDAVAVFLLSGILSLAFVGYMR